MFNKKIPKARRLPNVFTKEQLLELFRIIEDPDVMMAVILGTFCGLRISEVCHIKKEDIDYDRMLIKIINSKLPGKTLAGYGKDRTIPIPAKVIHLIKMWSDQKEGQYFFGSITKANEPLTTFHLFRKYKNALKKAGLTVIDHQNKAGNNIARYNFLQKYDLDNLYKNIIKKKELNLFQLSLILNYNRFHLKLKNS